MLRLVMSCGPMLWPMVVLTAVVLAMTLVCALRLLRGQVGQRDRSSINAVLFWGVVTAVLGVLGQWMGLYKVTQVILRDGPRLGINPRAVGMGFAEALRTSILGVAILILSGVAWFLLQAWWRRLAERGAPRV